MSVDRLIEVSTHYISFCYSEMSKNLVRTFSTTSVRLERFYKPLWHKGPFTGKDDMTGATRRHDLRGTTQLGKETEDGSMMAIDPLSVPKIVVPNLRKFRLKPFVSKSIEVKDDKPAPASEYLDYVAISKGSFK